MYENRCTIVSEKLSPDVKKGKASVNVVTISDITHACGVNDSEAILINALMVHIKHLESNWH